MMLTFHHRRSSRMDLAGRGKRTGVSGPSSLHSIAPEHGSMCPRDTAPATRKWNWRCCLAMPQFSRLSAASQPRILTYLADCCLVWSHSNLPGFRKKAQ